MRHSDEFATTWNVLFEYPINRWRENQVFGQSMKGAFFDSRHLITVMELLSLPHRLKSAFTPTLQVATLLDPASVSSLSY